MSIGEANALTRGFGVLFLLVALTGCATLSWNDASQRATYNTNIRNWNSVASTHPEIPSVSSPDEADRRSPAELEEINALFDIAFRTLAASERASAGITSIEPGVAAQRRSHAGNSLVRVAVDRGRGGDDPYVLGVLLHDSGWVLTLAHPFAVAAAGEPRPSYYLSTDENALRFPLTRAFVANDSNLTLAKFDLTIADGADPLLQMRSYYPSGRFAFPHEGAAASVVIGEEVFETRIAGTGRSLSLGDDLVFTGNIIVNHAPSLDAAHSGTPIISGDGSLAGLYYHRSADGATDGFVGLRDLPALIASAIAAKTDAWIPEDRR